MPAFIRTPEDEARWSRAKDIVKESKNKDENAFGDQDWALVNHVYQQMHKADMLIDKLKKAKDDIDDFEDIQDHGDESAYEQSLLNDPYDEGVDDDEEYEGEEPDYESVADSPDFEDEDDEAGKWLKEQQGSEDKTEATPAVQEEKPAKSKSGYSDWAPRNDYSAEHQAAMKKLMDDGYSHREAERMVGAYQGPKDMQSALKHTVRASAPSARMLSELKELAGHWLDNARRHEMVNAEVEKNPDKFAAGKLMQAHEDHTKKFKEDYDNFLNSDEVKNLKGLARHKAVSEWKKNWQSQNPDYAEGHKKVAEAQTAFKQAYEAKRSHRDKLNDLIGRMAGGGMEGETYGAQEAAQHVGGGKDDEGAYTAHTFMDPAAAFAQNNPEYIKAKQQELQGQQQQQPQKPKMDTKVVIRRHANPQQMERLKHVTSQRAAMGIKPKGEQ